MSEININTNIYALKPYDINQPIKVKQDESNLQELRSGNISLINSNFKKRRNHCCLIYSRRNPTITILHLLKDQSKMMAEINLEHEWLFYVSWFRMSFWF